MALHLTFSAPHLTGNLITVHETLHHGPQRLAMSERFLIGATFNAGVMQATNTHPPTAYSPRVGSGTLNAQGTAWTSVRQPGPHNFTILRQTSIRLHPTSPWQHQWNFAAAGSRTYSVTYAAGRCRIYLTAFGTRRYIAEAINGIIIADPAAMNTLTIIEKEDVVAIGYTCLENMITLGYFEPTAEDIIKLYHSAYPEKPSSTAGVAFVLNKKFVDTENIREYDLIPGRAHMIVIPWHKGESLNILNIYAPNRPEEQDQMGLELC
ncbi:hypothetical protein B0H13DRAFT_2372455 [Mycena leptocephala]|nr:hypothetical protein B0H13DRAFT_2372455 [Mycena leptocephala]